VVEPSIEIEGPEPAPHPSRAPWSWLPNFCALLPVVWCLSYGVTLGVVGAIVGRQSSTAGLPAFFAVIGAPFLAGLGLVIGKQAAATLRARAPGASMRFTKRRAALALLPVAVVAALLAVVPIYVADHAARPRVIAEEVRFQKRIGSLPGDGIRRAVRVHDHLAGTSHAVEWADGSVNLASTGGKLQLAFTANGAALEIPLAGIDYINYVDAIPLRIGADARPVLALLVTGRATGRRDLLAIVSASGELLYLELLDRFWNFRTVPLAIASSLAGDLILVGSDPRDLMVFSPQVAP
jgi:hypothetical protein